jgi:hypothetical protein
MRQNAFAIIHQGRSLTRAGRPGATCAVVRYRRRGQFAIQSMEADKIVDCRQISSVPSRVTNPAVRNLLDAGLARLDPLGIGIDITLECAVVDRSGLPSERLFAISRVLPSGRSLRSRIFVTNARRWQTDSAAHRLGSFCAGHRSRRRPSLTTAVAAPQGSRLKFGFGSG